MSGTIPPPPPPIEPVVAADYGRRSRVLTIEGPSRTLALCLASFAVMAPWPLLGMLLLRSQFESSADAFLFFGGITLFPLLILALFGSVSEDVLIAILMLVWFAAALIPSLWIRRRIGSWRGVAGLLGAQALFSLAQAVMGALLLIGRSV